MKLFKSKNFEEAAKYLKHAENYDETIEDIFLVQALTYTKLVTNRSLTVGKLQGGTRSNKQVSFAESQQRKRDGNKKWARRKAPGDTRHAIR